MICAFGSLRAPRGSMQLPCGSKDSRQLHTFSTLVPHFFHTLATLFLHFSHTFSTLLWFPHFFQTFSTLLSQFQFCKFGPRRWSHFFHTFSTLVPHFFHFVSILFTHFFYTFPYFSHICSTPFLHISQHFFPIRPHYPALGVVAQNSNYTCPL